MFTKKTIRVKTLLVLVLMLSVVFSFCLVACNKSDSGTDKTATAISITNKPTNNTMTVGESAISLHYVLTPADATIGTAEWSVSNSDIATITSNGVLTAVSNGTTEVSVKIKNTSIKDSFNLIVIKAEPTINELLSDLIASGVYNENTPEVERVPLDPDYIKLVTRREALLIGESYTETFDNGDFLDTKLFPVRSTEQVTANISEDNAFIGSTDRALCFESVLPNGGVYLTGMQFVAGARYSVEMDYNILQASNQFYFQFRSYASGVESDVFVTLPTSSVGVGKLTAEVTLKDFSDYEIMLFCGTQGGGKISVDNIKIARQELPQEENTENFDNLVDNLTWTPIGGAEIKKSEITIKNCEERSLSIVTTLADQGVVFTLDGKMQKGVVYEITFALKAVSLSGNVYVDLGSKQTLECEEGFEETITLSVTPETTTNRLYITTDCEASILVDNLKVSEKLPVLEDGSQIDNTQNFSNNGGMSYSVNNDAKIVLTRANLADGAEDIGLYVKSEGAFGGVNFEAKNLTIGEYYKVSFNIKLINNPNSSIIYVQLGGGGDYKQFDFVSASTYNPETGYISFILKANVEDQLQIFANMSDLEISLDNIVIEEAIMQEENTENFDGELSMAYSKNENATLSLIETTTEMFRGVAGKALKVVSNAQYGGVVLETTSLSNDKWYLVSFNIRVINANGSFVYIKLGNGEAKRLDPAYAWDSTMMYSSYSGKVSYLLKPAGNNLVIFGNAGNMEFVIDNVSVKEYTGNAQTGIVENFDDASNISVSSNGLSDVILTTENLPEGASNNALFVNAMENYAGVVLKLPKVLTSGKTYAISFNCAILGDYSGPIYVQQYQKSLAFQFDKNSIVNGKITGNITVADDSNTLIQIFAQNAASFVMDNIEIQEVIEKTIVTSAEFPFTSTEAETDKIYAWASTGANTVEVTESVITIKSTDETYAGAYIRIPMYFDAANNYKIVFNTNATHGLYINIDGGTDTAVSAVNGRVSVILSGVNAKNVIRVFANNTANADYTINNLYVENIKTAVVSENFDTWSDSDLNGDVKLAVPNPYSGENIPTLAIVNGAINVTSNAVSDYYGVYIKLDKKLEAGKSYVITFDFDGDYSPYVKAATEVQCTPQNGKITATVEGGDSNEIRIMIPSAPNADFTIDNIVVK